ncbi:MAG: DUF5131 family protein [Gammaproteobacteria bacterium]|nr:DUF5131 family protein [Gammaproteobacteria bacterium]
MADQTGIEWCDSTHNEWIGCTRVSPACDHCYAAVSTPARTHGIEWGAGKPRTRTKIANRMRPRRWNRKTFFQCDDCRWRGDNPASEQCESTDDPVCPKCAGTVSEARRRVFCSSLSDWLDNEVPIEWLVDLLDTIRVTPSLDWLLLTKRIGNWRQRIHASLAYIEQSRTGDTANALRCFAISKWLHDWLEGNAPANVQLGITVINQPEVDRDVGRLLAVPARIHFLSVEPMLGPIELPWAFPDIRTSCCHVCGFRTNAVGGLCPNDGHALRGDIGINWIICGGESGYSARPMHLDWVKSLRDQCVAAGVPFLFKQWGEWLPSDEFTPELNAEDGNWPHHGNSKWPYLDYHDGDQEWREWPAPGEESVWRVGKKRAGRRLDGRTWDQYPEVPA